MNAARKKVRIRRAAGEPLLAAGDVDDLLDAFAADDAEVVNVDVAVPDEPRRAVRTSSGVMKKVDARVATEADDGIEELTDGVVEGWEDEAD